LDIPPFLPFKKKKAVYPGRQLEQSLNKKGQSESVWADIINMGKTNTREKVRPSGLPALADSQKAFFVNPSIIFSLPFHN